MTYIRKNVWKLGGEWAPDILWYARGVKAMKDRALAEPTSWRFYAGIHGFNPALWSLLGYFQPGDQLPSQALIKQFWSQCQHGSWYFLPWHRGYLLAFEANIRAAVVSLNGPTDWALPYWNYFEAKEAALPVEFASPTWPDGNDNPLYVVPRYGPNGDGNVFVPLHDPNIPPSETPNLKAMRDPYFTGVTGGSPGFGGIDTGFSHNGGLHGGIESQPHDLVHVWVGGSKDNLQRQPGAMSVPDSAGLDPIFWLHHANIDRLWVAWNGSPPPPPGPGPHANPSDAKWVDGPASVGERPFTMPMPDGTTWTYTPGEMTDTQQLGYQYDDLTPGVTPAHHRRRLERLGLVPPAADAPEAAAAPPEEEPAVPANNNVELVGATTEPVSLRGTGASSQVQLDSDMRRKVTASLAATPAMADAVATPAQPDRVFLNLENVRGLSDAVVFRVYVGVPQGADPAAHPELLAGTVAPFGMTKASRSDDEHAGQGLTFVLEITDIVDGLHLANSFDVERLPVRIVPDHPVPDEAAITIGRISIFRQGS